MKAFRTIESEASAELIVKKSRFIALACPVESVPQAQEKLDQVRKEYHDASHHCYAYCIGENNEQMKFSDDGEPQGTAGYPMLDVLQKRQLTNLLIVVTRYFGGVLLGANGLVRAYCGASSMALDEAGVCEMVPSDEVEIVCPYALYNRLERLLRNSNALMGESYFDANVRMRILCRKHDTFSVMQAVIDASNGEATCTILQETQTRWPVHRANV